MDIVERVEPGETKMAMLTSSEDKKDTIASGEIKMDVIASSGYKSSDQLLEELFETFHATNNSPHAKVSGDLDDITKSKKAKKRRKEEKLHKEKRKAKKHKTSKFHKEKDLLNLENSSLKTENGHCELPTKEMIHLKIKIADDNQSSNGVKREAFSIDEAFHTLGIATTTQKYNSSLLGTEVTKARVEARSLVLKREEEVKLNDFVVEKDQDSNNVDSCRKGDVENSEGSNDSTFEAILRKLEENRNRLLNSKNQSRLQCEIHGADDDDYKISKLMNCQVKEPDSNDNDKCTSKDSSEQKETKLEISRHESSKSMDKLNSYTDIIYDSRRHLRKHKNDPVVCRSKSNDNKTESRSRSSSRNKSRDRNIGTKRSNSTSESDKRNIRRLKLVKDKSPDYSTSHHHRYHRDDGSYKGKKYIDEKKKRERSKERIDKKKLLEIARKNAILMANQQSTSIKGCSAVTMKTVAEFTNFCEKLSRKERKEQGECSNSGTDCDTEDDADFSHPFQLKGRSQNIILNIKNSVRLPVKTGQENMLQHSKQLRLQFPVSSGQDHRNNEDEWVPVVKDVGKSRNEEQRTSSETVYPVTSNEVIDVGAIVTERLTAIRRLHENPNDLLANNHIQVVNRKMNSWAASKLEPGKFTGSTGANVLTPAQLSSGYQAWVTKDQLIRSEPVRGGVGMSLLQKMGWKPGEGLGKDKQGPTVPFAMNIKVDKRGLTSEADFRGHAGYAPPVGKSFFRQESIPTLMSKKHPVSLLNEYCSKKRIDQPKYICREEIEAGRPKFAFTVQVKGMEFQSTRTYSNKKEAKSEAATLCLTSLGLLPSTEQQNVV